MLLVSVRSAEEAQIALAANVDWIDLKNPDAGSLGAPELAVARDVAAVLMGTERRSVALGELRDLDLESSRTLSELFPTVKVGLSRCALADFPWRDRLRTLAESISGSAQIVPVVYADYRSCDAPPPADVLDYLRESRSRWLLIDTFLKDGHTLLDYFSLDELAAIQEQANWLGATTVFAGSLNQENLVRLHTLRPKVIAVRGAVCEGDRRGTIKSEKILQLQRIMSRAGSSPENERSEVAVCLATEWQPAQDAPRQ